MTILDEGARFIWENARHLERAIFDFHFFDGPAVRIIEILRTYQNKDGGFGHALEPDVRAPESQPLFIEFGLHTLYECNLRDPEMTTKICDFISKHADLEQGIPTLFPSAQGYPKAAHWNTPYAESPSLDRLAGLVGLANWQGVSHPWLEQAVERCLENIATIHYTDAHTILTAFCLLESLPNREDSNDLFDKLRQELSEANFFFAETPFSGYGLTPLTFAPTPDSFCSRIFSNKQIENHLADLQTKQVADGGWPLEWEPPGEMARMEWRSHRTVKALITLRAYKKI